MVKVSEVLDSLLATYIIYKKCNSILYIRTCNHKYLMNSINTGTITLVNGPKLSKAKMYENGKQF